MSCGIPNCKRPKFTPGGNKNFGCLFWIRQVEIEQEKILEDLQNKDNDAEFYDDYEDDSMIDKVIQEQKTFFPDTRYYFYQESLTNKSVDEAIANTVDPLTQQRIKEAFVKIKAVHKKHDEAEANQPNPKEQERKPFQRLNSIPTMYDPRSQQVLKRHAEALKVLFEHAFPELGNNENPQVIHEEPTSFEDKPSHHEERTHQFDQREQNDQQEFAELFHNTSSLIESVIKLLDHLVAAVKPETRQQHLQHSGLMEALPNRFKSYQESKVLNKFWKRTRYLKIDRLVQETKSEKIFFVCSDKREIVRLYNYYPNVFYLSSNFEFDKFDNYEEIVKDYDQTKPRIIMINSLKTIPDKIYLDSNTMVVQLEPSADRFYYVKENHVMLPRYLYYEYQIFQMFETSSNRDKYKIKIAKYEELIDKNNSFKQILSLVKFS